MPVKPLSPEDVNYNIPDFVIETVNQIIKNKYRGNEFTFKAKELIYLALSTGVSGSNKDWYAEKWMDFENCCGKINKELKLSDREWACGGCNEKHDRDVNAAINIRNFGLRDKPSVSQREALACA